MDKTSKQVAAQVDDAYRNAEGFIVDTANQIVNYLPTSWPDLTDDLQRKVVGFMEDQFYGMMDQVKGLELISQFNDYAKCLGYKSGSATNAVLVKYVSGAPEPVTLGSQPKCPVPDLTGLSMAKIDKTMNDTLDAVEWAIKPFLPLIMWLPIVDLEMEFRDDWWTEADHKANVKVNLDFFGLKKYSFGIACVAFSPNGQNPVSFSLNGGCNNPWKLDVAYKQAMDFAKDVAKKVEKTANEIAACFAIKTVKGDPGKPDTYTFNENCSEAMQPMMAPLLKAASSVQNPREYPAMLVQGTINSVLATFTGVQVYPENNGGIVRALQNLGLKWLIPSIQATSARVLDEPWKNEGKINLTAGITYAGFPLLTSDIGCLEMGTRWDATPKATAKGGCDNKWGLEIGGKSVYEEG